MESPTIQPAASAVHMREEDVVLGVVVAGEARAYPWWIAKNFHVINDSVAGVPVAIAFCEQCTGAAAFRRELDGRVLSMEVPGVYNGTILLKDRETGTLWAPFSGKALEGPLAAKRLTRIPATLTRWSEWKARHPETGVVWGPAQVRGGHGSWYAPGKWGIVAEMGATIQGWDSRLPENTLVYGLEARDAGRAYTLEILKERGLVNDTVKDVPVVVLARGEFEAAGYDRRLRDRLLDFQLSTGGSGAIIDQQTQSTWSAEGVAMSGPLQGERLTRLEGHVVEWHVWAAYNPGTDIFALSAPADTVVAGAPLLPALLLQPVASSRPEELRLAREVTLIALWSTWCAPCRDEMPRLELLHKTHAAQGLSVLGIAVHMPDDDVERQEVQAFLSGAKISFPNRLMDDRTYGQLESLLRRTGRPGLVVPTILLVDKERRVRAVFAGKQVDALPAALARFLPPR
jgi:thiol-disulfide isomerase/thioredoxin